VHGVKENEKSEQHNEIQIRGKKKDVYMNNNFLQILTLCAMPYALCDL
jgi:hypothetical protein